MASAGEDGQTFAPGAVRSVALFGPALATGPAGRAACRGCAWAGGEVRMLNQPTAPGLEMPSGELKLRRMLNHLLDEEIALDLPPEQRGFPGEMIKELSG